MSDGDAEILAAIRARAERATSGPWRARPNKAEVNEESSGQAERVHVKVWSHCAGDDDSERNEADVEFIAHARTDVPFLLARVGQLEAEAAETRTKTLEEAIEAVLEDQHRRLRAGTASPVSQALEVIRGLIGVGK